MRKILIILFGVTVLLASHITTQAKFDAPYYDLTKDGGTWDGNNYELNGETIKDAFFCDGTYTYFLQADGTPMKNRLTYHPDGEHIIYFDHRGHEVFSNFANVKKSISGTPVDDLCFFDVYGYMYVNVLTYDKSGEFLYYANAYGVMERDGWFQFSENAGGVAHDLSAVAGKYAYAYKNGIVDQKSILPKDEIGNFVPDFTLEEYIQPIEVHELVGSDEVFDIYLESINDGELVFAFKNKSSEKYYTTITDFVVNTDVYENIFSSLVFPGTTRNYNPFEDFMTVNYEDAIRGEDGNYNYKKYFEGHYKGTFKYYPESGIGDTTIDIEFDF